MASVPRRRRLFDADVALDIEEESRTDMLIERLWPAVRRVTEHPLAAAAESGAVYLGSLPVAVLAFFEPESWRLSGAFVKVGGPSALIDWSIIATVLAIGLLGSNLLDSRAGRLLFLMGHVALFAAMSSAFAILYWPSLGAIVYGVGTVITIAGVARQAREAQQGARHDRSQHTLP